MKTEDKKLLAIIPARAGSKGLPSKNIAILAGIPLIAHSIKASLGCPRISRTIVTTESEEIGKIVLKFGAEVIERPGILAEDNSAIEDVVVHVLYTLKLQGGMPDFFVLLQPTSPLRKSEHIKEAADIFFSSNASSLVSITTPEQHPYKSIKKNAHGYLEPLFEWEYLSRPRQMLPEVFSQNGAIYMEKTSEFIEARKFVLPPCIPYYMPPEESVDVDTLRDLVLCEYLIAKATK